MSAADRPRARTGLLAKQHERAVRHARDIFGRLVGGRPIARDLDHLAVMRLVLRLFRALRQVEARVGAVVIADELNQHAHPSGRIRRCVSRAVRVRATSEDDRATLLQAAHPGQAGRMERGGAGFDAASSPGRCTISNERRHDRRTRSRSTTGAALEHALEVLLRPLGVVAGGPRRSRASATSAARRRGATRLRGALSRRRWDGRGGRRRGVLAAGEEPDDAAATTTSRTSARTGDAFAPGVSTACHRPATPSCGEPRQRAVTLRALHVARNDRHPARRDTRATHRDRIPGLARGSIFGRPSSPNRPTARADRRPAPELQPRPAFDRVARLGILAVG